MPKIVDRELYQAELLDRCFPLFTERGYAAITMRQIVEGLGVSTGTLYHYFESKQDIFEKMVWRRVENDLRAFGDRLHGLDSIESRVELVFSYFGSRQEEAFNEVKLYLEYYQSQLQNENKRTILNQVYDGFFPEIENVLGITNPIAAQILFSSIDGLLMSQIYGCEIDWQAQGKMMGKMMATFGRDAP
jgi:AcrR family transcriptional regulator